MTKTFATEREAKRPSREQEMTFRDNPTRMPPTDETLGQYRDK